MEGWDPLIISGVFGGDNVRRPRWINGRELAHWQDGPDLDSFLDRLEANGWEIINSSSTEYGTILTVALRPRRSPEVATTRALV